MYSLGTTKFLFAELKGIYKLSDNGSIGHRTSDLVPGMKVKGLAALFSSFASWKFTKIKFKLTEFIKKYLPTKKPNNSSKMGFSKHKKVMRWMWEEWSVFYWHHISPHYSFDQKLTILGCFFYIKPMFHFFTSRVFTFSEGINGILAWNGLNWNSKSFCVEHVLI